MRLSIISLIGVLLAGNGASGQEAKPYAELAIEGDYNWITYLALSGNGKVFAVSHADSDGPCFVTLFDAVSGKLLRQVDGPKDTVGFNAVSLSPDGKRLAVGGIREILMIDAESGKLLHKLENPHYHAHSLPFSPDGLTMASCGYGDKVILWDVKTGKKTATLKHSRDLLWSVAFSSDGKKVTALGFPNDGDTSKWVVQVWDRATSKELSRLKGKKDKNFVRADLSPNGEVVVVAKETSLELWDISSGKLMSVIEVEGYESGYEFSADGKSLITVGYTEEPKGKVAGRVERWDVKTGKKLGSKALATNLGSYFVLSRRGDRVAIQDGRSTVKLWSADKFLPVVKKDKRGEEKPTKP